MDRREVLRGMALGAAGLLIPARLIGDAPKSLLPVRRETAGPIHDIDGEIVIDGMRVTFHNCVFHRGVKVMNGYGCVLTGNIVHGPNVSGGAGVTIYGSHYEARMAEAERKVLEATNPIDVDWTVEGE